MQASGIIQYQMDFVPALPVDDSIIAGINSWRRILYQLKLVGQDDQLYQGLGFGNLSRRLSCGNQFVITASQTGHIAELETSHYTVVTDCNLERNRLAAQGPMKPSSEALTHAAVYRTLPEMRYVFHAHNATIWQHAEELGLPSSTPGAACGTQAMACEIERLCTMHAVREGRVIVMGGHQDGIITFGVTADEAGSALVECLAAAYSIA